MENKPERLDLLEPPNAEDRYVCSATDKNLKYCYTVRHRHVRRFYKYHTYIRHMLKYHKHTTDFKNGDDYNTKNNADDVDDEDEDDIDDEDGVLTRRGSSNKQH